MTTGIFYSHIFKSSPGPIIGPKFINFPEVLGDVLKLPNVKMFEHEPVSEEFMFKFHTEDMVEGLKKKPYGKNAFHSVGACITASNKIMGGELKNDLLFNSASGHHAGPTHAWGGTYLNCVAPAVHTLRENFDLEKFVLLDTDAHHGDGDRNMFKNDHSLLHVCFCGSSVNEDTNVCVGTGWGSTDKEYIDLVRKEFVSRVMEFKPGMIFYFLGHDTSQGDYGDIGLTPDFFVELVKEVKKCAEEVCEGRYLIITGGGARRDVAEYIFPRIARILAS